MHSAKGHTSEGFEETIHPVQALVQILVGIAVAQAHVSLRAEVHAGDQAHQAFFQHFFAEGQGIHAVLFDVDEHVEGPLRLLDLQAHVREALVYVVTALAEKLRHGRGVALQGGRAGGLDERGGGHHGVLVEDLHPVPDGGVRQTPAQAPAGHGVGLGKAVDDDNPVPTIIELGKAVVVLRVDQAPIHIVAEDEDGPVLQDLVDRVQRLLGVDAAGGVVGRGEDDGFRPGRNGGLQGTGVDLKAVVLRGQGHGHAPAELGDGLVEAEGRGGDDHLVPGIQHGGQADEEALRGSDGQNDLIGGVLEAVGPLLKFGDGLQHVGIAVAGGIVGVVPVQGGLGGLLHHVRGVLVRLADGQGAGAGGVPHQEGEAADAGQLQAQHGAV